MPGENGEIGNSGNPGAGGAGSGGEGGSPPAGGAPPANNSGQGTGSQPEAGQGSGSQSGRTDTDAINAQLAELRRENAARRKREQELEKELNTHKQAQMSETEKQASRIKELEEENQRLARETHKASVMAAATRAGSIDPEAVAALIPADAEDIDKAIEAMKKTRGYLFRTAPAGSADGGNGTQNGGNTPNAGSPNERMNNFIRGAHRVSG